MTNTKREWRKCMRFNDIRRALRSNGEYVAGNLEITLDNTNYCEVTKDGEFEFACSEWWELEEYLKEIMWNPS